MAEKQALGRLVKVNLREYWLREDTEFTPWLADPDNLNFLSDVVGMDLELVNTETKVGSYRADIFCHDNYTDSYVLIENQIEPTNHTHLGQIMTYAAGLSAKNIIWVAERFNEEHRAALDWLNGITDRDFHFFGIEIELWKIGDSPPAPKFNIVAKPNDWSKSIKSVKQADWTERAAMYREIWTNVLIYLGDNFKNLDIPNTSGLHWIRFPMPNTRCVLSYSPKQKKMSLFLLFRDDSPAGWFDFIYSDIGKFESTIGNKFEWSSNEDGTGAAVATFDYDHSNEKAYSNLYDKIGTLLIKITSYFSEKSKEFANR